MATDWHAEYVKAAALQDAAKVSAAASSAQQTTKTQLNGVQAFVDLLLVQEGGEWWTKLGKRRLRAAKKSDGQGAATLTVEDKKQLKEMKKRLAAVASQLLVKLPELNASVSSKETPGAAKVRVLQLQLVCRMLRYGVLTKKRKEDKKMLKKEIRGLLDRVALLLDAANPPSLADADERSPFQEFMQQHLASRMQVLMPELMKYLLKTYELEEEEEVEDDESSADVLLPALQPVVKPPPPSAERPTPAVHGSILSALRQERPSKRARPESCALFKEVQLPHLQQTHAQSRPQKSRRLSKNISKSKHKSGSSSRSSQDALLRAARPSSAPAAPGMLAKAMLNEKTLAGSNRRLGETDLLRRAAIGRSSTSTASGVPLLHRTLSERPRPRQQTATAPSVASKNSSSPPLRRAATTSSVVMRTPDRPKRMAARTTRRVLVEASPPLRRPSSATTAPRLLQPMLKHSRSGPAPLFK